jgi:Polyketide cyclase / dehydrase and lipid transport
MTLDARRTAASYAQPASIASAREGAPFPDVAAVSCPPGERRRTLSTVENDPPGGPDLDRRSTTVDLRVTMTESRWERRVVVDATVNHRIEAVFPYLADPTRWHDFAPAVVFRKQIDTGPIRVGTRWMATDRIGPFRIHFIDRLESLDENRSVAWLSSAPWNARVEYACADSGTTTRIRADYIGQLSDSLRWQVGWLPGWATHGILARDFRRLDRRLTLDARAAGRWQGRHPPPSAAER